MDSTASGTKYYLPVQVRKQGNPAQRSFWKQGENKLVARIAKATQREFFDSSFCKICSGNLSDIPSSVVQLDKKSVRCLWVLRFHWHCPLGSKDELIICVGLLKRSQIKTTFRKERMEQVKRISILINIYKLLAYNTHPKSWSFGEQMWSEAQDRNGFVKTKSWIDWSSKPRMLNL